jgi:hypothetical protein
VPEDGVDAIRGEAKPRRDATEDSPRTTNETKSSEWLLGLDSVPLAVRYANRGATGGQPKSHE